MNFMTRKLTNSCLFKNSSLLDEKVILLEEGNSWALHFSLDFSEAYSREETSLETDKADDALWLPDFLGFFCCCCGCFVFVLFSKPEY